MSAYATRQREHSLGCFKLELRPRAVKLPVGSASHEDSGRFEPAR